jgi:dTDP-4-dehydrorhamnose reductase
MVACSPGLVAIRTGMQERKTVIIIGQGQIGRSLAESLTEYAAHVWQRDIDDLSINDLERIAPYAVVNAAGKTDLAWCEANAREAVRTNLEAPVRLYECIRAIKNTPRFIHFSSGCVWDGPYREDGKPFEPNDPVTPACLYSWTKAASDALLLAHNANNVAILRARQVYSASPGPRNTLNKLTRYSGLIDTPNSMTSLTTIVKMVRHALEAEDWTGVWNVYDRGIVTPYEVGVMLADAGMRERPEKIAKDQLDSFHHPKRVDTVLHDARFETAIDPPDVRDEIRRAIESLSPVYAHAH